MTEIGVGIIGGGYMGKAHAVAMSSVGAVFGTGLRPRLEMVAASSEASAKNYAELYGFARFTGDWRNLTQDPKVQAVIVASPPETHLDITRAVVKAGKALFCEKPLGASLSDAEEMTKAVEAAGIGGRDGSHPRSSNRARVRSWRTVNIRSSCRRANSRSASLPSGPAGSRYSMWSVMRV